MGLANWCSRAVWFGAKVLGMALLLAYVAFGDWRVAPVQAIAVVFVAVWYHRLLVDGGLARSLSRQLRRLF